MLGKYQWLTIAIALLIGVILYSGFSLKDPELKHVESKRILNRVENAEPVLIAQAEKKLDADKKDLIHVIKKSVEKEEEDSLKVKHLKDLSGKWFDFNSPVVSAIYAKRIAEIQNDADSWAIAGSTSYIALRNADSEDKRNYAGASAIQAYENAISLAPDDIALKVNLALTYTEFPPKGEPMKGVLMLVDLEKEHPDEPLILKSLAQLSIRTGQYEKAVDRLEKVVEMNPHDQKAWCLLADTYQNLSVNQELVHKAIEHCGK